MHEISTEDGVAEWGSKMPGPAQMLRGRKGENCDTDAGSTFSDRANAQPRVPVRISDPELAVQAALRLAEEEDEELRQVNQKSYR